ncbi:hypothetical protein HCH52_10480 [Oscillospiraceae bacterium HV4-5-C5C]|nr:hypothetical protein [Oscillospiraceae bacterium HV4-5-C5C]
MHKFSRFNSAAGRTALISVFLTALLSSCSIFGGITPSASASADTEATATSGQTGTAAWSGTETEQAGTESLPAGTVSGATEASQTESQTSATSTGSTEVDGKLAYTFNQVSVPDSSLATTTDDNNWERWPGTSSLDQAITVDLSAYQGAAQNAQALQGITVIVDPGHGLTDPGAVATDSAGNQIREADITLPIGLALKDKLEAMGATVVMTRTSDSWVSLYSRVAIAGNTVLDFWDQVLSQNGQSTDWTQSLRADLQTMLDLNADDAASGGRGICQGIGATTDLRKLLDAERETSQIIYVSVHANTSDTDPSAHGLQTYISTNDSVYASESEAFGGDSVDDEYLPINPNYRYYNDADRTRLAQSIFNGVSSQVPALLNAGGQAIYTGNYAFLREINLTSVLVETGFMSNADDLAVLTDSDAQQQIAQGIADGVYTYFCQN